MKRSIPFCTQLIACLLTVLVSQIQFPTVGVAMLVPAETTEMNRPSNPQRIEDIRRIERVLESKVLRERLHRMGMNDEEINSKLNRLSDEQLHQFAARVDSVAPGGDGGGLLIGLLVLGILILLFIYLFKLVVK